MARGRWKRRLGWAGAMVLGGALVAAPPARADRRAYGTTYEAVTAPKGELDVESWMTFAKDGEVGDSAPGGGLRQMEELEYGLTRRWDVALYNMLDVSAAEGGTRYAGLKVESRLRLADPGEWPVDVIGYLEYEWQRAGDADHSLEAKAIVARDFGPWNVAGNLSLELEHLVAGAFHPEVEYALGACRELGGPAVKLGLEAFGKLEREEGALQPFVFAGPAVSFAVGHLGPLRGVWLTLAGGRGLTPSSETAYGRAILGLQF